jgi:hypothetical protein
MDNGIPAAQTIPQQVFFKQERIGKGRGTKLFADGEVDTILVGERYRHVVLASWYAYVERQLRGEERDPAERAEAARRYRASVSPQATAAAARALHGKLSLDRPRGSGKRRGSGRAGPD